MNSATHMAVQMHEGADSLLVATVGVVGTLLGVVIGSGTAFWRQRQHLAHDRKSREVEDLRRVLDDGVAALGRTRATFVRLMRLWAAEVPTTDQRRVDASAEQRAAAAEARSAFDRLSLRIAPDDQIFQRYKDAMTTLDQVAEIFTGHAGREPYAAHHAEVNRLGELLETQIPAFAAVAREKVGPLPRPGGKTRARAEPLHPPLPQD